MRISRRHSLFASCLLFVGLSATSLVMVHCSEPVLTPQDDAGPDSATGDSATPDSATADSGQDSATTADGGIYPVIVGHRGASGYRPEHTIASYELAIAMGADFIEPDVVSTKDGVLVVRHENEISGTTDVASHPEFADRKKAKSIDGGKETEGWWTEDFTLAELKTLRARERLPGNRPANTAFDGLYEIPTLQEVVDLAKRRGVGIYPETKHPTYFRGIGLPLEEKVAQLLRDAGWHEASDPVYLQSFEPQSLQRLKDLTNLKRVQLLDAGGKPYDFVVSNDPRTYADLVKPEGLAFIATYAQGIGPNKSFLIPRDANDKLLAPTTVVADAHKAGLIVHPFTFRNENPFLPADFRMGSPDAGPDASIYIQARGDAPAEYRAFFALGIDGLFSDFSDTAVATRRQVYGR
ncbi:glycerophosphodiester phosphodiesterase [Pendulispora rubella]|uniref:glycerophosphodiester phosphodiesterase n=1 Tax=Pendulispora rubella TaxID=2741070 RepID=A0ABZ2KYG5_9BACT